jgi:hypothetical protein
MAGMMKVILALEKGIIPPNSENLQVLNPRIDDEFWNLRVSRKASSLLCKADNTSFPKRLYHGLPMGCEEHLSALLGTVALTRILSWMMRFISFASMDWKGTTTQSHSFFQPPLMYTRPAMV